MSGRKPMDTTFRGNFVSPFKKTAMQNPNRNRFGGGGGIPKSNYFNQVSPWLPQNVTGDRSNFRPEISSDPQAQLQLANKLISNLLSSNSQLNVLSQPPSLLSLGGNSSRLPTYGASTFTRDRYGLPRSNVGKIPKRNDFKNFGRNKRPGNERKNQSFTKKDQNIKNVVVAKNTEKQDDVNNEETVESTGLNQSVSVKTEEKSEYDLSAANVGKANKTQQATEEEEDEAKVSYSEIPFNLLYCHICRKHMWDDVSFEKHLEGKPHKMMVEELERSYELKVALLRHEMRVMEQQRENDIHRAFRKGKSKAKMQQRGFCTMCDLNFLGMLPAHRKNERHQRLKKFLHPKCNACAKEFYTRLEWDEHKLSAGHLKKIAEVKKETRPDLENTDFDITDFIEDINEEFETELIEIKVTGKRENVEDLSAEPKSESCDNESDTELAAPGTEPMETDAVIEKQEKLSTVKSQQNVDNVDAGITEETPNKNGEDEDKDENEKEDDEGNRLPKYTPGIPVGEIFIMDKKGYLCRACNRFMFTREDNKIHCQTMTHYNNIIRILKAQNKIINNKKRLNASKNVEEKAIEMKQTDESIDVCEAKRLKLESTAAVDESDFETPIRKEAEENSISDEVEEKYDPESESDMSGETLEPKETVPIEEEKREVSVHLPRMEDLPQEPAKEQQPPKKVGRPNRAKRGRRNY